MTKIDDWLIETRADSRNMSLRFRRTHSASCGVLTRHKIVVA